MSDQHKILIIGAGPAGLAAALALDEAGREFEIVDRAEQLGGLAKTYVFREKESPSTPFGRSGNDPLKESPPTSSGNEKKPHCPSRVEGQPMGSGNDFSDELEFRTDHGPHRFFSKNRNLYDLIGGVLGERWIPVKRQTRQYVAGKFFDYPINAVQAMKNLGPVMVLRCAFGYAAAVVRYRWLRAPIRNFRDWAYASFGRPLAEFNIINYTEKIWGVPTERLHLDWAQQRIAGLDVWAIAKNAAARLFSRQQTDRPKSLVDVFYYPDMGAGFLYERVAAKLTAHGRQISLRTRPTRIRHSAGRITAVTLAGTAGEREVACDHLIESVHVTDFLKLLDPAPPAAVAAAAGRLKYRSQVHLFVTLDKPKVTDDQWVYFPEQDIPFARSSEMRNFSAKMSPLGKTSLFIEFFCNEGDDVHRASAQELFGLALPHFERFGFFRRAEVRNFYRIPGGKDYPIYDLEYQENLATVKKYLDGFANLHYIGRPGRFKYTNQDHSLEMGLLAAQAVLEGKRADLDAVGGEKEYFEKGSLRGGKR